METTKATTQDICNILKDSLGGVRYAISYVFSRYEQNKLHEFGHRLATVHHGLFLGFRALVLALKSKFLEIISPFSPRDTFKLATMVS